jgi:hypothetical protein
MQSVLNQTTVVARCDVEFEILMGFALSNLDSITTVDDM